MKPRKRKKAARPLPQADVTISPAGSIVEAATFTPWLKRSARYVLTACLVPTLVGAAGLLWWDWYSRPHLTFTVAQQRELNWVTVEGLIVLTRMDQWDVVGSCLLFQAVEMEVAQVDSIDPWRSTLRTAIVVKNSGRKEATGVRFAFQVDSIAPEFMVSAESLVPHSLKPDTAAPGVIRGLADDVQGSRVLSVDRFPPKSDVVIFVEQTTSLADRDTAVENGIPAVKVRGLYALSAENGLEAPRIGSANTLDLLASVTSTDVLVSPYSINRGFSGRQLMLRWYGAYRTRTQDLGPRACVAPKRFQEDERDSS